MDMVKKKLFGDQAQRVSTEEMLLVFEELKSKLVNDFIHFELVRFLSSKKTHGDIDILVLSAPRNMKEYLQEKLGESLLQFSKNDYTNSTLYHSSVINKGVHVDFIVSTDENLYQTRKTYFAYSEFSFTVGIIAKKLHFKFGTEGFFKRFKDKKGIWHDLFITYNLNDGLKVLGFAHAEENIESFDDIVKFLTSSPMVDSSYFSKPELDSSDRQSVRRRPGADYITSKLRELNLTKTIEDENHYFKSFFPEIYEQIEEEKKEINSRTYALREKYNGNWIMEKFNLKPGPLIGKILLTLEDRFGEGINEKSEEEVMIFILATFFSKLIKGAS